MKGDAAPQEVAPGIAPILAPDEIDPDWLTTVLRHSGALEEGHVTALTLEDVGTGQVGRNVRFTLTLEGAPPGAPASVVGKFPSDDPVSRATGVMQGNYDREVRFYRELVQTVDIQTPRCFHAAFDAATSDFVLLFEDLAPAVQGDQITGCSLDESALALSQLAGLHAPRWQDPALADASWMDRPEGGEALLQAMYLGFVGGFVERYGARLDDDAIALIEAFGPRAEAWASAGKAGPVAVVHGDYRLDNMMFGTEAGGYPLAVVDWQTPARGHPAADASYFLGAGLPVEARREHEHDLLGHYHAELLARGVSGYDFEACWRDYRFFAFSGVVMAVIASMIVGQSDRGDAMFLAMASRHSAHALDLDSLSLF